MISPLPGYVLIEPINEELQTSSGVYLPETAQDKTMKGKVISLGEKIWDGGSYIGAPVKENDLVYYRKWQNETVKDGDKELLFVKFSDLLGVIT